MAVAAPGVLVCHECGHVMAEHPPEPDAPTVADVLVAIRAARSWARPPGRVQ